MPELGRLAVCLALLCALFAIGAGITGAQRRRRDIIRSSAHAAYATFALVLIAAAILLRALVTHDFSLEYVAAYSSSTLPRTTRWRRSGAARRARCSSGRSC
jgi:cytochrome c-type biogenesis protein CcmF